MMQKNKKKKKMRRRWKQKGVLQEFFSVFPGPRKCCFGNFYSHADPDIFQQFSNGKVDKFSSPTLMNSCEKARKQLSNFKITLNADALFCFTLIKWVPKAFLTFVLNVTAIRPKLESFQTFMYCMSSFLIFNNWYLLIILTSIYHRVLSTFHYLCRPKWVVQPKKKFKFFIDSSPSFVSTLTAKWRKWQTMQKKKMKNQSSNASVMFP